MRERERDAIRFHVVHEGWHVIGHPEKRSSGVEELDVDGFEDAATAPGVARKVHGFLRRAGALDRHRRLREKRFPGTEAVDEARRVRRQLEAIVRGYAIGPECLDE